MIEPILDNLLLEPLEHEDLSTSGIYRPESSKEEPAIGKILAIGPKVESKYKGRAVYKKWQANKVKYEGKTYILISEKDVLGVIK